MSFRPAGGIFSLFALFYNHWGIFLIIPGTIPDLVFANDANYTGGNNNGSLRIQYKHPIKSWVNIPLASGESQLYIKSNIPTISFAKSESYKAYCEHGSDIKFKVTVTEPNDGGNYNTYDSLCLVDQNGNLIDFITGNSLNDSITAKVSTFIFSTPHINRNHSELRLYLSNNGDTVMSSPIGTIKAIDTPYIGYILSHNPNSLVLIKYNTKFNFVINEITEKKEFNTDFKNGFINLWSLLDGPNFITDKIDGSTPEQDYLKRDITNKELYYLPYYHDPDGTNDLELDRDGIPYRFEFGDGSSFKYLTDINNYNSSTISFNDVYLNKSLNNDPENKLMVFGQMGDEYYFFKL